MFYFLMILCKQQQIKLLFIFQLLMLLFFKFIFKLPFLMMFLKMIVFSILKLLKIFFKLTLHNKPTSLTFPTIIHILFIYILQLLLLIVIIQVQFINVLTPIIQSKPSFISILNIFIFSCLLPIIFTTTIIIIEYSFWLNHSLIYESICKFYTIPITFFKPLIEYFVTKQIIQLRKYQ